MLLGSVSHLADSAMFAFTFPCTNRQSELRKVRHSIASDPILSRTSLKQAQKAQSKVQQTSDKGGKGTRDMFELKF